MTQSEIDEQFRRLQEAEKAKDTIRNEMELNPDISVKEISAENLEKLKDR